MDGENDLGSPIDEGYGTVAEIPRLEAAIKRIERLEKCIKKSKICKKCSDRYKCLTEGKR